MTRENIPPREDILRMSREAGLNMGTIQQYERFTQLIANALAALQSAALRAELDHIPDAGKMVGPEPVHHAVIAGALFDFMGWLTSRKERLALSSADEASPAVDAIRDFAKMRGLSLDDAKVQGWDTTRPAQLNDFNPDWDAMAVMVEEQQRMAKRIAELEALLERQTARIVNLQDEIRNLTGEE